VISSHQPSIDLSAGVWSIQLQIQLENSSDTPLVAHCFLMQSDQMVMIDGNSVRVEAGSVEEPAPATATILSAIKLTSAGTTLQVACSDNAGAPFIPNGQTWIIYPTAALDAR
jgi:hypothetical protein